MRNGKKFRKIERTDGSPGSNDSGGGVESGINSSSGESFQKNTYAYDNTSIHNNPTIERPCSHISFHRLSEIGLQDSQGGRYLEQSQKRQVSFIGSLLPQLLCKKAKKTLSLLYGSDKFSFKNFMSCMIIQNQADKERQDKEMDMCRFELNVKCKESRVRCQMMQKMMTTLMI